VASAATFLIVSLLDSMSSLIVVVIEKGCDPDILLKLDIFFLRCCHIMSSGVISSFPFLFTAQVNTAFLPVHIETSLGCVVTVAVCKDTHETACMSTVRITTVVYNSSILEHVVAT